MTTYKIQPALIEVKFKNNFTRRLLSLCAFSAGKYSYWGMGCLKFCLTPDTYEVLMHTYADIIISCGSSLAAVNLFLTKENLAKSLVVFKPGVLGTDRFDLVIMPKHDKPPKEKNIVVIDGALSAIDQAYLKEQSMGLKPYLKIAENKPALTLGLFIGGNTKRYSLTLEIIKTISQQIKEACQNLDAHILITTSRRTQPHMENILKEEFATYHKCPLLVIANEKNIKEAVGGILGLSDIVLVTSESISMLSEAASSGRYVLAIRMEKKKSDNTDRHSILLDDFVKQGYIRLIEPNQICDAIKDVWEQKPSIHKLDNSSLVYEGIKKI